MRGVKFHKITYYQIIAKLHFYSSYSIVMVVFVVMLRWNVLCNSNMKVLHFSACPRACLQSGIKLIWTKRLFARQLAKNFVKAIIDKYYWTKKFQIINPFRMTTYSWILYKLHYEIFDRYQQNLNLIATSNLEESLRLIINCQHSETYYLSIKYVASWVVFVVYIEKYDRWVRNTFVWNNREHTHKIWLTIKIKVSKITKLKD